MYRDGAQTDHAKQFFSKTMYDWNWPWKRSALTLSNKCPPAMGEGEEREGRGERGGERGEGVK